jgi:non-heme chloroperoxidase
MTGPRDSGLELVEQVPLAAKLQAPVLFLHGAYGGAWCWQEHFMPYFAGQGVHSYALSLRGHGNSPGRDRLSMATLSDYVEDLAWAVGEIGQPPVLVGHSMGGMIIQKYLERQVDVAGVVLMASVPPQGLGPATLRLMMHDPMLLWQMSMIQHVDPSYANLDTARRVGFSDAMPDAELQRLRERFGPESSRAIWDMTVSDLVCPWRIRKPPMLVLGGADDALFPPSMVRSTASAYDIQAEFFPDMAHVMMLEPGWQRVADRIIAWMADLES